MYETKRIAKSSYEKKATETEKDTKLRNKLTAKQPTTFGMPNVLKNTFHKFCLKTTTAMVSGVKHEQKGYNLTNSVAIF